jgi:hypothetical protein
VTDGRNLWPTFVKTLFPASGVAVIAVTVPAAGVVGGNTGGITGDCAFAIAGNASNAATPIADRIGFKFVFIGHLIQDIGDHPPSIAILIPG